MNQEYYAYATSLVRAPSEQKNAKPKDVPFTLNFNVEEIDESFFFDENQAEQYENKKESKPLEPDTQSTLFSAWLQSTRPDEEVIEIELPNVFQQAERQGKKVADQLNGVSAVGLGAVGNVFSSLSSMIGACGPICAHTVGALGNVGTSFGGVGVPHLNRAGLHVDEHGRFHLDGSIDQLSRATGISRSDLYSGKVSVDDILSRLCTVVGEGLFQVFGFGLITCFFDMMFPTPRTRLVV